MLQVRLHGRPRYHSCKAGDAFDGSMLRRRQKIFGDDFMGVIHGSLGEAKLMILYKCHHLE